ncbi:MAG TPA: hypothetical protein VFV34_28225, partial [Blastocatellia bacterium]|nr:hypothetical protein [Blastocatellia bacterium]
CDLDGTPLKSTDGAGQSSNRLWSLLGVALLVGALAISAAMIIFQPRGPVAQSPRPQPATTTVQHSAPNVEADRSTPGSDLASTVPGSQIDAGTQKVKPASGQLPIGPAPDPKAAAIAAEAGSEKPAGEAKPAATSGQLETERPIKAVATDSGANAGTLATSEPSTATQTPTEPKKEPKARAAKEPGQDPAKGDDKKKGGFLKVFKKIFGNNK